MVAQKTRVKRGWVSVVSRCSLLETKLCVKDNQMKSVLVITRRKVLLRNFCVLCVVVGGLILGFTAFNDLGKSYGKWSHHMILAWIHSL